VTSIVVGGVAGQGGAQIAGNALAPYAASLIGQQFDHTDDPNKAAQLLSHAVLGATLAYLNGGNAAAGAAAGAGSEAAAQYLTKELYPEAFDANGTFDRTKLTEAQANHIIGLGAGIGALVGGATGGSVFDGAVGGEVGRNAVEGNQLHPSDALWEGDFSSCLQAGGSEQHCSGEGIPRLTAAQVAKLRAAGLAVYLGAVVAPEVVSYCLANPVFCNSIGLSVAALGGVEGGPASQLGKNIDLHIAGNQLAKKRKHAIDFGVTITSESDGAGLLAWSKSINQLMSSNGTIAYGTYRGSPNSRVFYNQGSGLAVVLDRFGNFVTGFKPTGTQLSNYLKNGFLQ
jgi:hypothetical protein